MQTITTTTLTVQITTSPTGDTWVFAFDGDTLVWSDCCGSKPQDLTDLLTRMVEETARW